MFSSIMHLNNPIMFVFLLLAIIGRSGAQPRNIFLLAGQSNMSGRGGVTNITGTPVWDGVIPPECEPNPAIFRFTVNRTWEEARELLHDGIDPYTSLGIGPGMPFANALLKSKPSEELETIGLVPCAIGGSHLNEWEKDGEHYPTLIERARSSITVGGVVKALLWYQGEADSDNQALANTYAERFQKFVNDVRTDLLYPTLPVIQVALASGARYNGVVRQAQLGIRLPNVRCVDAIHLQLGPDAIHLTTPSQVLLGEQIARDFLTHF